MSPYTHDNTLKTALIAGTILLCTCFYAGAQHTPIYSQYMFNTLAYNPAYAGAEDALTLSLVHRTQWTSLPGAPQTQTLTAHAPLINMHSGVGFTFFNDNIGVTNSSGAYFSYAYRLKTYSGNLSFGLQGGTTFFRGKWATVTTTQSGDPAFLANSPLQVLPNFGTGMYYQDDQFTFSVAVPELLTHSYDNNLQQVVHRSGLRNLIISASGKFKLHERITMVPNVMLQNNWTTGAQVSWGTNVTIDENFIAGLFHRSQDASIALFAVKVNEQLQVGYSYDFTLSALRRISSGSHEIRLKYTFGYSNYSMNPRSFF